MPSRKKSFSQAWSVYQRRGHGGWVVRYKDRASGKWRDKRIPVGEDVSTKRQAEAWARKFCAEEPDDAPAAQTITVAEYTAAWESRRKANPKIRRTTRSNNEGHLKNYILPWFGAKTFAELSVVLARDFVIHIREAGLAPSTVRNVVATIKTVMDEAVEEGLLRFNLMRSISVQREVPEARLKAGGNVVVHLPLSCAEQLLACDAVPEDRKTQYLLVLSGGFRPGELFGFTWRDLVRDGDVPYADVNKAIDSNWEMGPPKTDSAVRKVPLHPVAESALRKWAAHGFVLLTGRPPTPADPVFPNQAGKHHRPKSAELLRADLAAAGCPSDGAEFRWLRRSFATWLAEAGVGEGLRRRLMGHSGAGVTDAHYTAKTLDELQRAVLSLPFALHEPKPTFVPEHCTPANDSTRATGTDGVAAFLAAPAQQTAGQLDPQPGGSAQGSNLPEPGVHQTPIGFEDRGPHQRTKRFRVGL